MLFCPLESVVYHHEDALWQERATLCMLRAVGGQSGSMRLTVAYVYALC